MEKGENQIFPFSNKLFYPVMEDKHFGLTHYQTILHFAALKIYSCAKRCEKRRNCLLQFLLFSKCFLLYRILIFHFKCTLKCRLHFAALNIYSCAKCKKRRNCLLQFLLFSQCFLPYRVLIFHFKCTLKCRLQFVSIWTSLQFCRLVIG